MESVTVLLDKFVQPFPRGELERLFDNSLIAQVAIDSLVSRGYMTEDGCGRVRVQRFFGQAEQR